MSVDYAWEDRFSVKAGVDLDQDVQTILYYTQVSTTDVGTQPAGTSVDLIAAGEPKRQRTSDVGAYVQVGVAPLTRLKGLRLTGNFRVDKVSYGPADIPLQYSWRGAVVYEWSKKLVTKIIAGRAFQVPSGTALFAQSGFGSQSNVIGHYPVAKLGLATSPILKPQTIQSIEGVGSLRVGNLVTLEGAAYFQQLEDKIEFRPVGADFVAANEQTTKILGATFSARMALGRFKPYMSVAYNQPVNLGVDPLRPRFHPLPVFPWLQGVAGVDVMAPEIYAQMNFHARLSSARGGTSINTQLNNLSPYSLPAYVVMDASVSTLNLKLLGPTRETRVVAVIRNVLNQRHAEPGFGGFDLPGPGRSAMLEVRQMF